jgi:hypothetical protein
VRQAHEAAYGECQQSDGTHGELSLRVGDDQQMVLAHDDVVAAMQLASAAALGLAVDEHWLAGEEHLDLAAAVDHPGKLE